jgi:hypothetical protein
MIALTPFGLFAVSAMLVCYVLESRSHWFMLLFAVSCTLEPAYGFLQGAWPFGLVEAVWSAVALRRYFRRACPFCERTLYSARTPCACPVSYRCSAHACRRICADEVQNIPAINAATTKSGHAVAVLHTPSAATITTIMRHFESCYRFATMGKAGRIMAIAAAHHRLNFIHPFPDGNGRVSRLMSHAMGHSAWIGAHGLWSHSRACQPSFAICPAISISVPGREAEMVAQCESTVPASARKSGLLGLSYQSSQPLVFSNGPLTGRPVWSFARAVIVASVDIFKAGFFERLAHLVDIEAE